MYSLKAVDETSVGSKLHLLHDVLERDEVPDVDRWWVLELVRRRVEVEQVDVAPERLGVGDDGVAERRLARAGRAW